jgi:hypothetical protein
MNKNNGFIHVKPISQKNDSVKPIKFELNRNMKVPYESLREKKPLDQVYSVFVIK